MIRIEKDKAAAKRAFEENSAFHTGMVNLQTSDYEKMEEMFPDVWAVRIEEPLTLKEELDLLAQHLKEAKDFEMGGIILCLEYAPDKGLLMEEMNDVHEFMNSVVGEDVEAQWSLGANDRMKCDRAIEAFLFGK